jgi:hypothetical protein
VARRGARFARFLRVADLAKSRVIFDQNFSEGSHFFL